MKKTNNGSLKNPFKAPAKSGHHTILPVCCDVDLSESLEDDYPEDEEFDDEDLDDTAFDDRIGEMIEEKVDIALSDVIVQIKEEVLDELKALVHKLAAPLVKAEIASWTSGGKYLIDQCDVCGEEHPGKECPIIASRQAVPFGQWL